MPHVSLLCFYVYPLYLTCDMDKCSLRHIHDPVLLSLKVEVICLSHLPYGVLLNGDVRRRNGNVTYSVNQP